MLRLTKNISDQNFLLELNYLHLIRLYDALFDCYLTFKDNLHVMEKHTILTFQT